MTRVAGELTCPRGWMPLAPNTEARLQAAFVDRSVEPSSAPVPYRIGGRWYCPGCGCRMKTDDHSISCERCGRHLTPFATELIELHSHGGILDPETGEPRYDLHDPPSAEDRA